MMRIAGMLLVFCALGLLLGCPQPINKAAGDVPADGVATGDTTPADDSGIDVSMQSQPDAADEQGSEGDGLPDEGPIEVSDDPAVADDPASAEVTETDLPVIDEPVEMEVPVADPDTPADVETPDNEPEVGRDGDETPTGTSPHDFSVNDDGLDDPQAALDAGRMLFDEDNGDTAPLYTEPLARVSRGSVAFAGYWTVAVVNQGGKARQTMGDDSWSFDLSDDGKCSITQTLDGDEWNQRGGWELVGDELTLRLGPGGQRSYSVALNDEDADVAVLTDDVTDAVLFCLRIDPEAKSPKPAKRYESDFGTVKLFKSGMAYWSGSYGEPEGSLNFRMLGDYMVGTWEQQPGNGFILLKLNGDEFSGWWWYEASTEFDGTWRGSAG